MKKENISLHYKKKVGFLAHGPASANSLLPIIEGLKDTVEVKLFAYHPYVSGLWNCSQLEEKVYPVDFSELDLIIYGTGSKNEIELNVPVEARKWGIPSVGILDCYWTDKANLLFRFRNKPTYIIVPNEEAKEKVNELRLIPDKNVLALGNPHFDRLEKLKQPVYKLSYPLNIVFFSQCELASDYSGTHPTCKEILQELVDYRKKNLNKVNRIIVAPHPRENKQWLNEFCQSEGIEIQENKSTELMLSSDVSVGMSCTLQYEAEIIGKPTIFYESKEKLWEGLNYLEFNSTSPIKDFRSTERCISFIRELLIT